ncbi:hypothetical protein N8760_07195, partial [Rhodobacteraceae bacterium]|nr:hypothetical protein [Paracoccaceae bacterium]
DKWGTLDCEIFSTNLGKISINSDLNGYFAGGCDRIGILESKSNGMRDLVCDQNKILRFNQHEYTR